MENSDYRPLPPPRNSVASKSTKKKLPVPLPRNNVNINNSVLNHGSSSSSSSLNDLNVLFKKHIKPEIKMACENIQERKKSVIENTRSMSICIEKSFRNLLPSRPARRHSISQTFEDFKPDICESPIDNDIFSSLSFDSPIPSDSNSDRSFSNYYYEADFYKSQPPHYPPPSLPQDIYDKIPGSSNSSSQCGSYSTENIYEFIFVGQAKSQGNSAYENWNPTSEKSYSFSDTSNVNTNTKYGEIDDNGNVNPTILQDNEETFNGVQSAVLQFDPLHNSFGDSLDKKEKEENEECLLLQEIDDILYSSHYSSIESKSVVNNNFKNVNEDLYTIPEPPDRVDSIEEFSVPVALQSDNINNIDFKEEIKNDHFIEDKPRKNSLKNWLSMKCSFKKVNDGSTESVKKMKSIPKIEKEDSVKVEQQSIIHTGVLFVSVDEKHRHFEKNFCRIVGGYFKYSTTKNQIENSISLTSLLSIQIVSESKQNDNEDIFCFTIQFISRPQSVLLGALCTTERLCWMQKFLGSVTSLFPLKLSSEFTRAGCATLKEGINSEWKQSWLLLHNRVLAYTKDTCEPELIDLRKVRNVVVKENEELETSELVIDCISKSIYLKLDNREISKWHHIIKAETVNSSPYLKDQQLTKDQVPVIVEKCIKFVYIHGCLSKGVYRRSGSCSNTSKLLSAFRKDAWAVHLTHGDYSVYDVSSVLKRFFRDLPEPLLTTELHTHLCNAARCNCTKDEKLILYRSLLERLPAINYVTVRTLLSHLYYIQLQSNENLMTVSNLASIWGPTIMHVEDGDSLSWSKIESEVVNDLIILYPNLFYVEDDERKRENRILEALKQYNLSNGNVLKHSKPSGDLKIWIYLGAKNSESCVNVTLSPSKTALMVCDELVNKMGVSGGYMLGLQEVVCSGTMFRPIHYSECLLDIVLSWAYWDVNYRKENYIICLKPNCLIIEIMPFTKKPLTICAELKFAEQKSKSFKSYIFEISGGKLICYKDKSGSSLLYEWFVKDLIWYIGYEPKRNPHTRWCITFILKTDLPNKLKDNFGWSIAGTSKEDHLRWMAALLLAQYGVDCIAPPAVTNLLDC